MRPFLIATALFLSSLMLSAKGAAAQSFARCAGYQSATVQQILPRAVDLANRAAAAVADDANFAVWFGVYSRAKADIVRANLKAVHKVLATGDLRFYCGSPNEPTCKDNTYAYVYSTEPYAITLCPSFFSMPMLPGGSPIDAVYEDGTMEGTLIHEISHFEIVANTDDNCYSRPVCQDMAISDPAQVLVNADSYQYFSEDVMFAINAAEAQP